jgi:hypothetical protein
VASTTLTDPLGWQNSTVLKGDVADAVAALKQEDGGHLLVMGSTPGGYRMLGTTRDDGRRAGSES